MTKDMETNAKFVKIAYETSSDECLLWHEQLSQTELDEGFDLQVQIKSDVVIICKWFVGPVRLHPNTGATIRGQGEWKTVFVVSKRRFVYVTTTNVEIFCE
jgi:hypothetical protein